MERSGPMRRMLVACVLALAATLALPGWGIPVALLAAAVALGVGVVGASMVRTGGARTA
ncbi:MAG TPA: hypothetical protein VMW47_05480 [Verrucomicrobiae bacterium]|nr:hypothetical protein [Verrucomicrobiae bacterium]